jgi:hypothetical protein
MPARDASNSGQVPYRAKARMADRHVTGIFSPITASCTERAENLIRPE